MISLTPDSAALGEAGEVIRQTQYTPVQSESAEAAHEAAPEILALEAAAAIAAPITAATEFMFMPAGVHELSVRQGGVHIDIAVDVKKAAAEALNEQLQAVNGRSAHRAFLDFDHKHGAASAWVKKFVWRDGPAPGVYVQVEWSKAGREAIEGKTYRAFSPAFHTNAQPKLKKRGGVPYFEIESGAPGSPENPAEIMANPGARLWFGGLVNDPAFSDILPLTAKKSHDLPAAAAAGAVETQTNGAAAPPTKMKTLEQIQAEKAALEARNTQLETRISELEAKHDAQSQADLKIAQAEKEALEARLENANLMERNAALEAAETSRKEQAADAAVEAMKNNGQIAMLDKEMAASYRAKFIADPTLIPLVVKRGSGQGALEAGRTTRNTGAVLGYGDVREAPIAVMKALAGLVKQQQGIRGMGAVECQQRGKLALEAAAIYDKEFLSTILDKDGIPKIHSHYMGLPLEAATDADSLGTLSGTLVTQRALQLFKYKLPLFTRIVTDFSAEPAVKGQTVSTRKVTVPSVQTYDTTLGSDGRPAGWGTASAATTVDANTSLDELVGVPIPLSMSTLASTNRNLFAETAPAAMYALAKYFIDKIYGKCTSANFNAYAAVAAKVPTAYATYGVGLVDFARSHITKIGAAFDFNEVPDEDRFVVLNPEYYAKGTNDPSLVTFFAGQQNPEIVRQGVLPRLNDFEMIKAGNFPTSNNRVGFAGQKNSLIALTRLPSDYTTALPGASNGTVTQVTDAETGLTMLLIQYVNHQKGYAEWLICVLLGADVGDKRGGLVITSQ